MQDEIQQRIEYLEQELSAEKQARKALAEASIRLNSLLNLPELLDAIMNTATQLLDAETSSLMLLDETGQKLLFAVATGGPGEKVKELQIPANQGIAGWVLQHDELAVVDDVANDPRFYIGVDQQSKFITHSILAVPLKLRDQPIGVMEVINKRNAAAFSERDQSLATALASLAAVAMDNARLYQKLSNALVDSRMSYRL